MENHVVSQLKNEFKARHTKNNSYSLRAFARDIGISVGHLSRIMNGGRKISLAHTQIIGSRIQIPYPKIKPENGPNLDLEIFRVISEWQHYAILVLTFVDGFKSDIRYIAKNLGITNHIAKDCVDRLFEVGLLLEDQNGNWKKPLRDPKIINTKPEASVRSHQQQIIQLALDELKNAKKNNFARRIITGKTFAISEAGLKRIKNAVTVLLNEVEAATKMGPLTDVYQLNVQVFPLSTEAKGTK